MQNAQLQEKIVIYENNVPFRIEFVNQKEPRRILKSHWHDFSEIIHFTSGGSTAILEQKLFHLQAGDSLFVNPYELHTLDMVSDNSGYFVMLIDPSFIKSPYLPAEIMFHNKISREKKVGEILSRIFYEYKNRSIGFDYRAKAELYLLYAYLLEHHLVNQIEDNEKYSNNKKLEKLKVALEFIEKNYMQKITSVELAKMLNLSKSHFTHLFSEVMKKNVIDYINEIRMRKAYDILKNTELNVTQTSLYLGFYDINYFSRLFKKYYGYPPSQLFKTIK